LAIVDLHLSHKDGLALMRDFAMRESARFPFMVTGELSAAALDRVVREML
jgi:hypothetical protein